MKDPSRPRGRADLFYQEVTDGGVLFDADAEKMYVLNATAAFVWNCCDGAHTVDGIVEELAAALGPGAPAPEALQRDVAKALEDFKRDGLLS